MVFTEVKSATSIYLLLLLFASRFLSSIQPTMTTVAATGLNVATPPAFVRPAALLSAPVRLNYPWKFGSTTKRMVMSVKATPEGEIISEKVEKSIQEAKETCADDPVSGECVAAWDEVEELSAAASHARDKKKAGGSDPLEEYCSDNPETDECRTYDN
ncbi:Calvin cycle protein CP12-1 [Hirschfeldia incana]|nr:Calvin cycle protein CP12-1 [Hirschfeldia incana]